MNDFSTISPHNHGSLIGLYLVAFDDIETRPRIINGQVVGALGLADGVRWEPVPLSADVKATWSRNDPGKGAAIETEVSFESQGEWLTFRRWVNKWMGRRVVLLGKDGNNFPHLFGYEGGMFLEEEKTGGSSRTEAPVSRFLASDESENGPVFYSYWPVVGSPIATPEGAVVTETILEDIVEQKVADAISTLGGPFVPKAGAFTIDDKKTFSEHPTFPGTNPVAATDGAQKGYVDAQAAAAQAAAEATAAADATTKANAAQTAAEATAAADATSKANTAESNANTYTDNELAAQTLDEHADVNVASATEGQVLTKVGSNWVGQTPGSLSFPTGVIFPYVGTTAPSGWVLLNDGTIGSASSGATTRANADTETLYTLLWNSMTNTEAPVTGGRGASAAADFAANKPIRLPLARGRAMGVAGAGNGLTSRANGAFVGAETHELSASENGPHDHIQTVWGVAGGSFKGAERTVNNVNIGTQSGHRTLSSGAGEPHNNMQPTIFFNAIIKL